MRPISKLATLFSLAVAFGINQASAQDTVPARVQPIVTNSPLAITKSVTDADNRATITVKAGTEVEVVLDGNMTTGFSWDVSSIQGTATQKGKTIYVSERPKTNLPVVGFGGKFKARFDTTHFGTSTINMEYKRPFEHGKPAAKFFTFKLVVTP